MKPRARGSELPERHDGVNSVAQTTSTMLDYEPSGATAERAHRGETHAPRYGHFDDARREYVINTPKTPYPWINYLGSEDFFSLISQQGGGYCFYRDARLRRLLRYRYNNAPTDIGGRYFYIREGDEYWTPTFMPVRAALSSFECRHGLRYTKITGQRNGLSVELLFLVPLGHAAEIHQVTVRNHGSHATRSFKLFSFLEFCLWNAYDDMTNYQRNFSCGEVEIQGSTIYHKT